MYVCISIMSCLIRILMCLQGALTCILLPVIDPRYARRRGPLTPKQGCQPITLVPWCLPWIFQCLQLDCTYFSIFFVHLYTYQSLQSRIPSWWTSQNIRTDLWDVLLCKLDSWKVGSGTQRWMLLLFLFDAKNISHVRNLFFLCFWKIFTVCFSY